MRITTLPVYSKLAEPTEVEKEPPLQQRLQEIEQRSGEPFQLSQHQLETYRALIDSKYYSETFATEHTERTESE